MFDADIDLAAREDLVECPQGSAGVVWRGYDDKGAKRATVNLGCDGPRFVIGARDDAGEDFYGLGRTPFAIRWRRSSSKNGGFVFSACDQPENSPSLVMRMRSERPCLYSSAAFRVRSLYTAEPLRTIIASALGERAADH